MENLCRVIQEKLFDIPSHSRSLLGDFEICIGGTDSITSENASVAEISLSKEMIIRIARWLGNEERIRMLISPTPVPDGFFGEQLWEQLVRDGKTDFFHAVICFSLNHLCNSLQTFPLSAQQRNIHLPVA